MAKKSSDHTATTGSHVDTNDRRDAAVFVVASDPIFLERVRSESSGLPQNYVRYPNIAELTDALGQFDKISLAFVLLVESRGPDIDAPALRQLRLDFPQLVLLAVLDSCDQQSSLRLQSIGVHSILLPPFDLIDVNREIATALPNVTQFKRHPDLMRRGQARLDFLIPSDLSYVLGVNHEISLLLKEFGFPPQDTRVNIPLACDEAITNAIIHGNDSNADKKVNIQIYVSHTRFRIRVRDQGAGFQAETVEDPRVGNNVMRGSGRGVFLMRKIMDTVVYKEDGRVLELEKLNPNSGVERVNSNGEVGGGEK